MRVARSPEETNPPSAEQVARVVAAVPTIGAACHALRKAGWRATIAANRITVEDTVFAQFIGAAVDEIGDAHVNWMVYGITGTPASAPQGNPCCHTEVVRRPTTEDPISDICRCTSLTNAVRSQSFTPIDSMSKTRCDEEGHHCAEGSQFL
jgi:hypothetical protein